MANRRAVLTAADMTRAAKVAKREGCAVTLRVVDGGVFEVLVQPAAPVAAEPQPAANAWDDIA